MKANLRDEWTARLEAARREPSWRARLEEKVLTFLLRRTEETVLPAPVPDRPFFRGQTPHGRARAMLSPQQRRERLQHIAQVAWETPPDTLWAAVFKVSLESGAQRYSLSHRTRRQARREREERLERWQRSKERGYW